MLASTGMANTAMLFGFCIELNALDIHSLGTPGHSALYKMVQSSLKKKTTKNLLWVGGCFVADILHIIYPERGSGIIMC